MSDFGVTLAFPSISTSGEEYKGVNPINLYSS